MAHEYSLKENVHAHTGISASKRVEFATAGLEQVRRLFEANHTDESESLLKQLDRFQLSPEQEWVKLHYLGFICYRRKEYPRARQYAQKLLNEKPSPYYMGRAHLILGLCYQEESRSFPSETIPQNALTEYDAALSLLEDSEAILLVTEAKSTLFADAGRHDEAIAMLQDSVRSIKEELTQLGWAYARIGEYLAQDLGARDSIIPYLETAVRILDDMSTVHSWVCSLLAEAYNRTFAFRQALAPAEKAVELAQLDLRFSDLPSLGPIWSLALLLPIRQRMSTVPNPKSRKRCVSRRGNPRSESRADSGSGAVQHRQDRNRQALSSYEHALKLDYAAVASQSLFVNAGVAALDAQAYQEAIHYMQQALEFEDAEPEGKIIAYYGLGESYCQLQRYDQAAANFRLGLQLTSADHHYYSLLMKGLVYANDRLR